MHVFDSTQLDKLRTCYPLEPALLTHSFCEHPLFETEALVALATRLPAERVEFNLADLPVGARPGEIVGNGLSAADTIRSIRTNRSWLVLKHVELDPEYRALLHSILSQVEPLVRPVTGRMLQLEGFIFLSSPGAVTPYHLDPEYNILLQMRGDKTMTLFPAHQEAFATSNFHEDYHLGGHRNLPFRDEMAPAGRIFHLEAGKAIYVPVKMPHWVRNGDEVSVSFSITWRSAWTYREAEAHLMNRLLRNAGLNPAPPRPFPHSNLAKSLAYRLIRKTNTIMTRPISGG